LPQQLWAGRAVPMDTGDEPSQAAALASMARRYALNGKR
jgi:hypothetical protein